MTLDKVDEAFWPEILANRAQIDEWISMYAIDEAEGWTNPPSPDFLRNNLNLLIDTRHFNEDFKERLVASIDRLDERTNGLMINGDNIQVLHLIANRYREAVKCIHIDPPYNTDTSGFLYKNNYRHSSWMSMMHDRIIASLPFLSNDSSFICHIDENEYENLWNLFQHKGLFNLGTVVWDKRNPMTGGSGIALQHEYMTWFSPDNITISTSTDNAKEMMDKVNDLIKKYGGVTDTVRDEYVAWLNSNEKLSGGDKAYRNISDDGRIFQSVSLRAPEPRTNPKFHQPLIHPITHKPCPVPPNGFSRTPETLAGMVARGDIIFGEDETVQPRYKMFLSSGTRKQLTSVISDAVKGTSDLHKYALKFPYCHSVSFYDTILSSACDGDNDVVMDFFAGSGTTGHAVIEDDRARGNHRTYILVEMGEYFDTVTKPRMQKVVYSADWKDGKPLNRNTGVPQIIKYLRLESYEDALSNIALKEQTDGMMGLFGEEYLIRYMLDLESRDSLLDVDAFRNPFAYRMKITEKNECKERPVDLIESFNYLIGLTVRHQGAVTWFAAKPASESAYDGAVELRKDLGGAYAFRQVEGSLPDGRRALVIWRTVTDDLRQSNAALDAYFTKYRINPADREYDVIFVNGDSNLENLRTPNETWKVQMTELEFKKRMFEEG